MTCTRPRRTRGAFRAAGTSGGSTPSRWPCCRPSGYRDAFEPGCSIGVLTAQLARRCDRLLACDGAAAAAVAAAATRNAGHRNVRVEQRSLPRDWPAGDFDLIVFSELLYYFGDDDLQDVLSRAAGALRPGGTLIAVHWRHPVPDYPRSGDDVHAAVSRQRGLARLAAYADPDFLAEAYLRADESPGLSRAGRGTRLRLRV